MQRTERPMVLVACAFYAGMFTALWPRGSWLWLWSQIWNMPPGFGFFVSSLAAIAAVAIAYCGVVRKERISQAAAADATTVALIAEMKAIRRLLTDRDER